MSHSAQYPSLVMIIRHGEKPGDPGNDKDGGPNLSILGSARAAALPSLFTPSPTAKPVKDLQQLVCDLKVGAKSKFTGTYGSSKLNAGRPRFPTPDFLFATSPGTSGTGSSRPLETITPLAPALQFYCGKPRLTINSSFANNKQGIDGLKSEIMDNPDTYGGKVILIAWHHGTIPELTEKFGVPARQLPWKKWPAAVFDLIFCIKWDGDKANLVVDYQQLLYGDTKAKG